MRQRVLITDGEERSVLAACRGLAQAGYNVSATATVRPAATHWSRACAARFRLPDPRRDRAAFVEGLERVLSNDSYAVVLPGNDASLLAISEQRERLAGLTLLGLPAVEDVRRSVDKVLLLEQAETAGLPAPRSVVCSSEADGRAAAAELGYPVAVKPARSFIESSEGLRQRTASIVESEEALARAAPDVGVPFIVQEYEARPDLVSCAGVMADGRLLAFVVVRYSRTWPPGVGSASFAETVTPPIGLRDKVTELVRGLGWQGIFELELFGRGERDFAAIDFNSRVFGWLTLAIGAGANLPAVWCDWLLGRDPSPVTARPGVRYRWDEGEVRHLLWQLRRGRVRAAATVALPRKSVVHSHFRLADPAPLAARPVYFAREALRRAR